MKIPQLDSSQSYCNDMACPVPTCSVNVNYISFEHTTKSNQHYSCLFKEIIYYGNMRKTGVKVLNISLIVIYKKYSFVVY